MIETKTIPLDGMELKFDDERGTFTGYASKFDGIDSYGDTIEKGAWTNTLKDGKTVPIFFNHERSDVPIGRYTSLVEDDRGLRVEGQLTLSIAKARDVYEAVKAGTISGLSVGFIASQDDFEWKADGSGRVFKNISDLREISIVTYPADSKARISVVRSEAIEKAETVRDLETILRDSGLSKQQSLAFISKAKEVFAGASLRDAEKERERKLETAFARLSDRL